MNKHKRRKRREQRYKKKIFASAENGKLTLGGSCHIEAAGSVDGENDSQSRFEMVLYSGGKMRPGGWKKREPLVVDIAGIFDFQNCSGWDIVDVYYLIQLRRFMTQK